MLMDWAIELTHIEKVANIWNKSTVEQREKFLKEHDIAPEYMFYAKKKWKNLM